MTDWLPQVFMVLLGTLVLLALVARDLRRLRFFGLQKFYVERGEVVRDIMDRILETLAAKESEKSDSDADGEGEIDVIALFEEEATVKLPAILEEIQIQAKIDPESFTQAIRAYIYSPDTILEDEPDDDAEAEGEPAEASAAPTQEVQTATPA